MIKIPTVDDWWDLTKMFPKSRKLSNTPLKDYGYMEINEYIKEHKPKRILEFGHGLTIDSDLTPFNYGDIFEIWGADDWQGLHYFPEKDTWYNTHSQIHSKYPNIKLVKGLLGDKRNLQDIPLNYFDLVCSVSVIEEIEIDILQKVIKHCYDLLKKGGCFLNTHDTQLGDTNRLIEVVETFKSCGFHIDSIDRNSIDWNALAYRAWLENPFGAMVYYQGHQDEDRKYWGHWATALIVAYK